MKKRLTTILITLALLMTTTVVAYALVTYITTKTQTSSFTKKEYFEMECSEIFSESSEVGLGETVSINPRITSKASVDMYVFIRVEMPRYSSGGLYDLTVNDGWSLVESEVVDNKWIEVYRYDNELKPDQSTTVLANKLTMKNMPLAEFAEIEEIDVSMTGFACRVADVAAIDEAWDYIKSEGYGDFFGHGLGHGVGLDIHEEPRFSPKCQVITKENMVITVEPGIYLPNRFGVRIEDLVVVTKKGYENLTHSDKELIILS